MFQQIFRQHKWRILWTYVLTGVECLTFACIPALLGRAIDDLIAGRYSGLGIYLAFTVGSLAIGVTRRRLDTRVFSRIWVQHSAHALGGLLERGVSPSKIISRNKYISTYVDFYEYTVPLCIWSISEFVVAFVAIVGTLHGWATAIVIPAVGVITFVGWQSKLVGRVEEACQRERETVDTAIVKQSVPEAAQAWDRLANGYIRKSDLDAWGWGMTDVLTILAMTLAMILVVQKQATLGTILALLDYIRRLFDRAGGLSFLFNHIRCLRVADSYLTEKD